MTQDQVHDYLEKLLALANQFGWTDALINDLLSGLISTEGVTFTDFEYQFFHNKGKIDSTRGWLPGAFSIAIEGANMLSSLVMRPTSELSSSMEYWGFVPSPVKESQSQYFLTAPGQKMRGLSGSMTSSRQKRRRSRGIKGVPHRYYGFSKRYRRRAARRHHFPAKKRRRTIVIQI